MAVEIVVAPVVVLVIPALPTPPPSVRLVPPLSVSEPSSNVILRAVRAPLSVMVKLPLALVPAEKKTSAVVGEPPSAVL